MSSNFSTSMRGIIGILVVGLEVGLGSQNHLSIPSMYQDLEKKKKPAQIFV